MPHLDSFRIGPQSLNPGLLPKVGASGLGHGIPCVWPGRGEAIPQSVSVSGWAVSCIWESALFSGFLGGTTSDPVYVGPEILSVTDQSPFSIICWGVKKHNPIHLVRPMAWEDLSWAVSE